MTNPKWYELFNTKFFVSEYIGVTRQHKALLEYVAQESHSLDFDSCMEGQKKSARTDSKDR